MTAVLISSELLDATRITDAFTLAGRELVRLDEPSQLDGLNGISLVLVDWDQRKPGWAEDLVAWVDRHLGAEAPAVLLYGPHADVAAHAAARSSGLGPMRARSKLFADLGRLARTGHPVRPIRPGR